MSDGICRCPSCNKMAFVRHYWVGYVGRPSPCPVCDGDGDCPVCDGRGCEACKDRGVCPKCGGEGAVYE